MLTTTWDLGKIEGDVVPFPMTEEQRRMAIEKLAGGASRQTPEYDGVQLFRAKRAHPRPSAPAPKEKAAPKTRTCGACGSTVKVSKAVAKVPKVKAEPPRKQKWWLYYGPGRMTGGFPTKQEAMNWYLRGGR